MMVIYNNDNIVMIIAETNHTECVGGEWFEGIEPHKNTVIQGEISLLGSFV